MIGKIGLAPMAGVTNWSFRKLCFGFGAEFAYTEMISAESVIRNLKINEYYFPKPEEKDKVAIQIFGSDPFVMAKAASMLENMGAWIDINAGCPVKKVVKKGAGSALLKDLNRLKNIIMQVKSAVSCKVSVKVRIGFEKDEFEKIYDTVVDAGADMIAVHGRTAKQMYSGKATWNIKNKGYIPLYINGDIHSLSDAKRAMEISKADGVLIARASIGKPWVFNDKPPSLSEIKKIILYHIDLLYSEIGERAAQEFRKFVAGYTKNLPNSRQFRAKVMKINDVETLKKAFEEYLTSISF
ncbi:NifR3 family protein [Thermosipho africanus Ob7]|uniref:tRNA-dihydrouridine synthase n=1 Tax=Thermosipho africanus (strain TCF52B) TaxID=484019 RepID=B7IGL0_THEAB|nr:MULTISPECIES: tRNA-dihydrouridine synthase family protein [Thermosipho]ACJ75224.1 NifR3 family protein [Thermosipho africanus TCF52B]MBZ4650185.1 nifR [Thermosipho sp. (in: thermotogales)]MDK2839412.1 tRNA-dihydrouridine synthase [Thermosipho sp. (in: thermotogales)]MDK2900767.1 tRNA-dihydrouridine synthase [Thermosipho sp. (in: thermotogales)]RDI90612.1 NifR3 family protein [Thermosipho africanus Ob7]